MRRFYLLIVSLLVISSSQAALADEAHQPRCDARQLDIRLLAVQTPGMMHERWLFGVINRGKHPCYLAAQAPWLSGEGADGVGGFAVAHLKRTDWQALPANGNRPLMAADRIVWFSVDLTHAEAPDFDRLHIRLAGLGQRTFTLPMSGNRSEIRRISPLEQDVSRWLGGVDSVCSGDAGWHGANWAVNLNHTVHCD
ncbi:hypothetical protein [Paludibacterium purpuratum]|uniref:DUF4232 domain-containing protein n=1 Tax=Paludibacterium purpuratum TaxID=1144873 RepID=A0A4R7BDL6_9NEIS|nr:hypothetical protein [Paludibacterium purpuratum]TDR82075.1 hypothetical protein DFP86_102189 [Paludibacterium purpuratum]